jgi:hypothetical protein
LSSGCGADAGIDQVAGLHGLLDLFSTRTRRFGLLVVADITTPVRVASGDFADAAAQAGQAVAMFVPSEMHDAFAVTIAFGDYTRETAALVLANISRAYSWRPRDWGTRQHRIRSALASGLGRREADSSTKRVPISRVLFLGCPGRLAGSAAGRHGAS